MEGIEKLASELVKQMTGTETEDPQHPDMQIVFHYLDKAWQAGAMEAQNDAAKYIQKHFD